MQPDLKLILDNAADGSHAEILVWHQIMLNASPYFQQLLAPAPFADGSELKSGRRTEIALPDTNPWAMTVLCDIFHLRTRNVPVANITSDQLFEIGVLVDRFDCADVVEPWSRRWMEQKHIQFELQTVLLDVKRAPARDLAKWICICRSNGRPGDQDTLESALIIHHTVDDLMRERQAYADYLHPSLINRMRDMRTTTITEFHAIMVRFADFVEQGDSCLRTSSNSISKTNSTRSTHTATHTSTNITAGSAGPSTTRPGSNTPAPPRDLSDRLHTHTLNDDSPTTAERFHCSSINLGNFLLAARAEFGPAWRRLDTWNASIATTYTRMQEVADRLTGPAYISRGRGSGASSRSGSVRSPAGAGGVGSTGIAGGTGSAGAVGGGAGGIGGAGAGAGLGAGMISHESCSLRTRFLTEVEDASRKLDSR